MLSTTQLTNTVNNNGVLCECCCAAAAMIPLMASSSNNSSISNNSDNSNKSNHSINDCNCDKMNDQTINFDQPLPMGRMSYSRGLYHTSQSAPMTTMRTMTTMTTITSRMNAVCLNNESNSSFIYQYNEEESDIIKERSNKNESTYYFSESNDCSMKSIRYTSNNTCSSMSSISCSTCDIDDTITIHVPCVATSKNKIHTNNNNKNSSLNNNNNNNNNNDNNGGLYNDFGTIRKKDGCFIKPSYYNKYTSCVINDMPSKVLTGMIVICNNYGNEMNGNSDYNDSREIEYSVNKEDFVINGIVFINHKAIKFMISIWHDNINDMNILTPTRIEFQKMQGDSMLFHIFWSEMLQLMFDFAQSDCLTGKDNNDNSKQLFGKISDCSKSQCNSIRMTSFETFFFQSQMSNDFNGNEKKVETCKKYDTMDTNEDIIDDSDNDINMELGTSDDDDNDNLQFENSDFDDLNLKELDCEYEYTIEDLDNMALDLINNYRNDVLDTLALICNKLENNIKFHKLFCKHSKIINVIINQIIGNGIKKTNNIEQLRGGLCVLVKIIKAKTDLNDNNNNNNNNKNDTKIEDNNKHNNETTTKDTQTTQQNFGTLKNITSKIVKNNEKIENKKEFANNANKNNDNNINNNNNKDCCNIMNGQSICQNLKDCCVNGKSAANYCCNEVESIIEYLVNETNILKQFPLLLKNSSKIVQNNTIRLMNDIFNFIPNKLKLMRKSNFIE